MQNSVEALGMALRAARKKKKLTQRGLADKLHMSVRTIIAAESGNNNPKFETVALLAKELGLSLDEVVFPGSSEICVPKTVVDFFSGKSDDEIQAYISFCQQIESFKNKK